MAYQIVDPLGMQAANDTSTTQRHPLGSRALAYDPSYGEAELIYLKGVAGTAVGSVVVYDAKNGTTTLAVAASKGPAAVALSANVASQYGWYAVKGSVVPVLCAAADAAGALQYVTAVAGVVDDAVVAGQGIDGLINLTLVGGAQALSDCEVNYPNIGAL